MVLSAGALLGPYEILAFLGVGGMGEVYLAKDTRLDRTVAIKVLPSHLAGNLELRQRLEREAKILSNLNHPHICTLHDMGHEEGMDYLVMEYLEGDTLAARLTKGPLPLLQALPLAMQIADALDNAHSRSVVHRDLKPANIVLTKSGAKLLDFGLARIDKRMPVDGNTVSMGLTNPGTILGTFQYMAPEQLEAKDADARTDLFAFGAVLYEMLTGHKAFEGKSQASLISAIMSAEPPAIATLQPMTPPPLERVVKTCLAKDPEDRWQSMRDVLLQLQSIAQAPSENVTGASHRGRGRWVRIGITAGIGLLCALAGWLARRPEPGHTYQVSINPPDGSIFLSARSNEGGSAVSPDGTLLAFVARTGDKVQLWVRRLDSASARPLPGTEGASYPFWSPDSRHLGFFTADKLKAIEIAQGPPHTLCDVVSGRGGSWNGRGDIVFAAFSTGRALHRIAASGGASTPVTALNTARGELFHFWPHFLPDGRHYLYLVRTTKTETTGIRVGTLDATLPQEDRLVVPAISNATYARPTRSGWGGKSSGHLFFLREGSLLAQAFDPADLEVKGDPFPIVEHVGYERTVGLVDFSASSNGTLVYGSVGALRSQLTWRDRTGKQLGNRDPGSDVSAPRLSPDGKRFAFSRLDSARNSDIWVGEGGGATPSRFTYHPSFDGFPAWSPDGSQIVFTSQSSGVYNLFRKDSNGAGEPERLAASHLLQYDSDWSRNGQFLLFTEAGGKTETDLIILPLTGNRKYYPFLQTQFSESQGRFSPDGRWIAYVSNETGTSEVYVQSFVPGQPASGARWKVSSGGGVQPGWRWDGSELFYLSPDHKMMAASVSLGSPSFQAGTPVALFSTKVPTTLAVPRQYEVTHDGQRFILLESALEIEAKPMTLVINWLTGTPH